jgi:Tol biopolymer transport system component
MNRTRIGTLGLLLAASLTLAACSAIRTAFTPKAGPGKIAFIGEDYNLYIADHTGQDIQQITKDAAITEADYRVYNMPVWAPDGQSIAFALVAGQQNQPPSQNGLYIVKPDGSGLTEAYTSPNGVVYYYWAPNGTQIGVLAETPGALALKLVPAAGGDSQTLDTGVPLYWTWAPDSQSVLIHADGEDGRLAVLQLGESVRERSLTITPSAFKAPAFSPDGKQLLVAQKTEAGKGALVLTDASGQNPQSLTEYQNDIAFAWSPDGKRIAYLDTQELLGPLTILDPTGRRDPFTLQEQVYAFFWSPDSKHLAYFTLEEIVDEASGATQRFSQVKALEVSNGQTREIMPIVPTERFLQLVPYIDQYHQSLTIWSPDSQNLVISTYYEQDKQGVFIVGANGLSDPELVADGTLGIWSWK